MKYLIFVPIVLLILILWRALETYFWFKRSSNPSDNQIAKSGLYFIGALSLLLGAAIVLANYLFQR